MIDSRMRVSSHLSIGAKQSAGIVRRTVDWLHEIKHVATREA
jgi:hypothetical protein